jgi:GT2 family glycosyltransferase/glycosyltransferase involved in cell wall biosynthesis
MAIRGHVDHWSDDEISGWFWDPGVPAEPVVFKMLARGGELASGTANLFRDDLKAAGVGEGEHAFRLQLRSEGGFYSKENVAFQFGEEIFPATTFTSGQSCILDRQHAPTERTTLFYFPDYSATNYYQIGLYAEAPKAVRVQAGSIHEALEFLTSVAASEKVVFHLHWTTPILAPSLHEGDARTRKDGFVGALRAFVRRGGVFYWTVHNLYPHDAKYLEVERELCRELASLSAKILVHNDASRELVASAYGVAKSKIHLLQHGNYEPLIKTAGRSTARQRVRQQYGIGDDDFVFSFLGQLRPYKGIDELLSSFIELRARVSAPRIWLLVAGKPVHPVPDGKYAKLARVLPNVVVKEVFLDDSQFNDHLFASDVAVCPYKNILTSGSILHALSAGVPVVAPDLPQITELVSNGVNGQLFGKEASLTDALWLAMDAVSRGDLTSVRCMESVARFQWPEISREFFDIICDPQSFSWMEQVDHDVRFREADKGSDTVCIVVNYEHVEDVARLVASLSSLDNPPDVVVVDSCSPGLHERAFMQLPDEVSVMRVGRNIGYAAAVNVGVSYAKRRGYRYLCVINPDMVAFPGSIDLLRAHAEREGDVLVSGLIYLDIAQKSVWFSGGRVQLKGMVKIGHDTDEFSGARETEYLSGACIFGSMEVFDRIGEWPEDYFLYFEETDWCQRAKALGIRLEVVAGAKFAHIKRSTLRGLPQPYYLYYYVRNALIFGRKYSAVSQSSQLHQLNTNFINPWLERLQKKDAALASAARKLVARGVEDGLAGRCGPVAGVCWNELPSVAHTHGHLETIKDGMAIGWVAGVDDCLLRVLWNGESRGVYSALQERADLPMLSDGKARQFVVPLPAPSGSLEVQQWTEEAKTLYDGQVVIEPQMDQYKANVDGISSGRLFGWAAERSKGKNAVVEILINDQTYDVVTGTLFRKDLQKAGIRDGFAGFSVLLDEKSLSLGEIKVGLRRFNSPEKLDERVIQVPARETRLSQVKTLPDFLRWSIRYAEATAEMAGFYDLRHGLLEDVSTAVIFRAESSLSSRKVSIIMPAFNRETTIERSLKSVLTQTHENWELLIVDDGSTDGTIAVVNRLLERSDEKVRERVSIVSMSANQGVSAARNAGLERATGDYIAYLDSDNIWHPAYLRTMLSALEQTKRGSAYCGQDIYYSEGDRDLLYGARLHPFCPSALVSRNFIDLNAFMHARFEDCQLWRFDTSMRRLVDWEYIIRVTRETTPVLVPAFLSRYDFNRAPNQITATVDFGSNLAAVRKTVGIAAQDASAAIQEALDIDIVNCASGEATSYMLEQFRGLLHQDAVELTCGSAHAVYATGCAQARLEAPTLVLFRSARLPYASLRRMAELARTEGASVVTGRLLAEEGAAKKSGVAHCAGVFECDLNLFAVADAIDDASILNSGGILNVNRSGSLTFAMLGPGIWKEVVRTAEKHQIGVQDALNRLSASLSATGRPSVLFDPSIVAFDLD